jgi:hypothetical protein
MANKPENPVFQGTELSPETINQIQKNDASWVPLDSTPFDVDSAEWDVYISEDEVEPTEEDLTVSNLEDPSLIKVARVFDSIYGRGNHVFSVVATNKSAEYVYPKDMPSSFDKKRIDRIIAQKGFRTPTTPSGWLEVALTNTGSYSVSTVTLDPKKIKSGKAAISAEKEILNSIDSNYVPPTNQSINSSMDELLAKDPEIEKSMDSSQETLSEQGMKRFIETMVDAAGTRDENPWLEGWLAGDNSNLEDLSGRVVLTRTPKDQEKGDM